MNAYIEAFRLFNRNVRLFLAANVVHGFAYFGVYSLLLNLYLLRLGYGLDFIGQVNAAGPLALAVASLPAGAFSRRFGCRNGLIVAYSFSAVGLLLLPLNEFLPASLQRGWILGAYAWAWASAALFVVNIGPFLMGTTSPDERSYAFSLQAALLPVFGFAGNLVGGVLPGLFALLLGVSAADAAPYRLALMLAGVLTLLAALLMSKADDIRVRAVSQATQRAGRSALPLALIVIVALVWMLRIGSEWSMRIYLNVYLDSVLATPTALIGLLFAGGQLFGLAALWAPAAIARFGKERTIIGAMIGMALAFLPLLFVAHWLTAGIGFMAMIGLVSLSAPAYLIFSQELVAPQWRTIMSSAMTLALGLGIAAVSFGGSYVIADYGYPALFALGALLAIAGTLLFWAYFRQPRGVPAGLMLEPVVAEVVVE